MTHFADVVALHDRQLQHHLEEAHRLRSNWLRALFKRLFAGDRKPAAPSGGATPAAA